MTEQNRLPQKTIPSGGHNGRITEHKPTVPTVNVVHLNKLAINVPKNISTINSSCIKAEVIYRNGDNGGKVEKVVKLIPVTKEPLTPVFKRSVGGHTVGGGGTSPEALRRAKRKARGGINK
jgi:hypothetical protein